MNTRMVLKLFGGPVGLLIIAAICAFLIGIHLPESFAQSKLLAPLGEKLLYFSKILPLVLLILALCWSILSFHRLWKWGRGETDICYQCGGLTSYKVGRYGPYMKCLACNKNRSLS